MKPIVVSGMDFSGTSMAAGILHEAGVNMGDVESAEDVARDIRPIRYRTYECRVFRDRITPLAQELVTALPVIPAWWLDDLACAFLGYCMEREAEAQGAPWGVKCNGLVFLSMYERFEDFPVQWVTTYRNHLHSMESAERKMAHLTPCYQMLLEAQLTPHVALCCKPELISVDFDDLLAHPQRAAYELLAPLGLGDRAFRAARIVDPKGKGVIPWP